MSNIFLTEDDIQRITEIKRGVTGKTRMQMQCAALRDMGIAFTTSRLGRPLVLCSLYENMPPDKLALAIWQPQIISQL